MYVIVAFVQVHLQNGIHITATPSLMDQVQVPGSAVWLVSCVSGNLWGTIQNGSVRISCKKFTFIYGKCDISLWNIINLYFDR